MIELIIIIIGFDFFNIIISNSFYCYILCDL